MLLSAINAHVERVCGVGIMLRSDDFSPYVAIKSVSLRGAANRNASLQVGVRITHIDGVLLAGLGLDQVYALLQVSYIEIFP